jgi:hypothetical protein
MNFLHYYQSGDLLKLYVRLFEFPSHFLRLWFHERSTYCTIMCWTLNPENLLTGNYRLCSDNLVSFGKL